MGSRYCVKFVHLLPWSVNMSEGYPGLTCPIMAAGSQPHRLINEPITITQTTRTQRPNRWFWLTGCTKIIPLHSCCVHMCPWCITLTGVITIMDVRQFSNSLHSFMVLCTLITSSPYTSIKWPWISLRKTWFGHRNWNTPLHFSRDPVSPFPMPLLLHVSWSS